MVYATRKHLPAHPPHPDVRRLLDGGWTVQQIADEVQTTPRCVYRWLAGDTLPIPVFRDTLERLPTHPFMSIAS